MFKDLQGAQGIARKKARKAGEFETARGAPTHALLLLLGLPSLPSGPFPGLHGTP